MHTPSITTIVIAAVAVLAVLLIGLIVWVRLPRRLNTQKYTDQWKELQAFCRDKKTWPNALQSADALLDTALKQRKYKGKTMGERMVSAHKIVSNNDALWVAHNLTKKVVAAPQTRLKEPDVKAALVAYRNVLKDIGAFRTVQKPVADPAAEADTADKETPDAKS